MSEIRYWIGLSLVPDVGPAISRKLLTVMESPEKIFKAGIKELLAVKGLNEDRAKKIKEFGLWDAVDKQVRDTEEKGINIVSFHDRDYPEVLKEIDGAPIVLYTRGKYNPEDRFSIAVVGSRNYTDYGEVVTQTISGELSSAGFTIISGMARGIDTFSHRSALASGGRTIAVLGSGLDISYPSENKSLMERIASSGCVISEFPPGTMPNKENFPRRNRLISGLSMGVLVVEATLESGSLITARCAMEQSREVFAVPGSILSQNSEGTNRLIRDGAKIVLSAADIIEELAPVLKGFIKTADRQAANISEEENCLCAVLTREPKHVDLLSREAKIPVNKVLELLLSLELKGMVRQSNGKRFYLS